MKKVILFLSSLCGFVSVWGQEQFNHIHSSYSTSIYPYMNNVFTMADTGYVMLGGAYYFVNNNLHNLSIDVNYFDRYGNFIWNKHYLDTSYGIHHGLQNACIKTHKGYILAGSKTNKTPTQDGISMLYLAKFDETFDTLWTKTFFADSAFVTSRGVCNTPDGGYLILGETELNNDSIHTSNYVKGLLLKVDSLGNYQWFKSYGTETNHDGFVKAVCTPDGGYLVGGYTMSWQDNLAWTDREDWWLVKTDSLGNMEWDRRYGSPIYGDNWVAKILKSADTCYYLVGSHTYNRNSTGSERLTESTVIKLDSNFNEVYTLQYDNQAYYKSEIADAIEDTDGNILLLGKRGDTTYFPRGTLHKITPEGEILWQRQYTSTQDTISIHNEHFFNSIKFTQDGGFVMGGGRFSDIEQQKIWLVKTDSLGCDGTGYFGPCPGPLAVQENGYFCYGDTYKDTVLLASGTYEFLSENEDTLITLNATVHPPLTTGLTDTAVNVNETLYLECPNQNYDSYQWSTGSNTYYENLSFSNIGTETVTIALTDGECSAVDTILIDVGTSNIKALEKETLYLYPNPAKKVVYIKNPPTNVSMVKVCDITGKTIKTVDLNKTQNIDIDDLKKGVYFVKAGRFVRKLVKQ